MKYAVEILRLAQKSLSIIQAGDLPKINHAIRLLADDPRPNGSRKLTALKLSESGLGNTG